MAAHRVNMCYSTREAVDLVQQEGFEQEDFSDSGSEENIVDSGREFVPVDLKVDSSDSDNNTFIFIIGIRATSSIKLLGGGLCLDSSCFAVVTEKGIWYDYGSFFWQVHILSFLKMYVFSLLFLVVYLVFFLNQTGKNSALRGAENFLLWCLKWVNQYCVSGSFCRNFVRVLVYCNVVFWFVVLWSLWCTL